MLSSAAHNKPWLVAEPLAGVLPRLYAQTAVDEALIRTVDLGPFKHRCGPMPGAPARGGRAGRGGCEAHVHARAAGRIDDGLELRKAAFECMDMLLDACPDRLAFPDFLAHLESGLKVTPGSARLAACGRRRRVRRVHGLSAARACCCWLTRGGRGCARTTTT